MSFTEAGIDTLQEPRVLSFAKRQVDADVVDMLEKALEKARDGELRGILLLGQDSGGVSYSIAGIKDRFLVTGFLAHAMHKLQTDLE